MKDVLGWKFPDSDGLLSRKVKEFPNTTYQQNAIECALLHVKKFDLALDIGANVGMHSVRFAKLFKQVKSFEPASMNYECLAENTKTFPNVEIFKKGIGKELSTAEISLPENSENYGAFSIIDFKNHTGPLISEKIEIIALDSLNLKPDLMKIDTQSFEMEVLIGSKDILLTAKPVLILEIEYKKPTQAICNFLKEFDYELVDSMKKDKIFVCRN